MEPELPHDGASTKARLMAPPKSLVGSTAEGARARTPRGGTSLSSRPPACSVFEAPAAGALPVYGGPRDRFCFCRPRVRTGCRVRGHRRAARRRRHRRAGGGGEGAARAQRRPAGVKPGSVQLPARRPLPLLAGGRGDLPIGQLKISSESRAWYDRDVAAAAGTPAAAVRVCPHPPRPRAGPPEGRDGEGGEVAGGAGKVPAARAVGAVGLPRRRRAARVRCYLSMRAACTRWRWMTTSCESVSRIWGASAIPG